MFYRFFIIIFLLFNLFFFTQFVSAQESEDLVRYSFSARFKVDFEGIKEVKIYTPNKTYTYKMKVIYQKPGFTYLEYLDGPVLKGKIVIDDGKKRLEYLPGSKVRLFPSLNSPLIKKRREGIFDIMLKNFDLSSPSESKFLARPVYKVSLFPKNFPDSPFLKLWIDKVTYLPLRQEKYNPQGKLCSSFEFIEAQFNKRIPLEKLYTSLPESPPEEKTFDFALQPVEKIQSKIDFPLALPEYLPSGYTIQGGILLKRWGRRAVKILYTNGLEVIVLFEIPRVEQIMMRHHRPIESGDLKMKVRENPFAKTLVWTKNGRTFILMGDLSLEELVKVASSIK